MKVLVLIAGFIFCEKSFSQTTIQLYTENITDSLPVYIAGNFNNWNPVDSVCRLKKIDRNHWTFQIKNFTEGFKWEYKYTQGSWARVEKDTLGNDRPNRTFNYRAGLIVYDTIRKWGKPIPIPHTITGHTFVADTIFTISDPKRKRKIWIYLPEGYEKSSLSYPVLYMQDAQNLFDRATSFAGNEWQIDENMATLIREGAQPSIIVAIENDSKYRLSEYSPWPNDHYGGGEGDIYINFIINTVKPYIDKHYRTIPDREHTGIGGSSMGGLISWYAGVRYPNIFSKILVFSPSFWFSPEVLKHPVSYPRSFPQQYYFLCGELEGFQMLNDMDDVTNIMSKNGWNNKEVNLQIRADGKHEEAFWAREFADAYRWLFGKNINKH